jgi:hypothetical protein
MIIGMVIMMMSMRIMAGGVSAPKARTITQIPACGPRRPAAARGRREGRELSPGLLW